MLGTVDLSPLQISSPSCLNITFCPASHHFWPQQTTSLNAACGSSCAYTWRAV